MVKIPLNNHLNFDAVRKPKQHGVTFKRIKTFKNPTKAEEYLKEWMENNECSRRHPPFVEETSIGLRLGVIYRVCIPILK